MRRWNTSALVIACFWAACLSDPPSARGGFVPLFSEDATQPFGDPCDNFEKVLGGNQTGNFPSSGQFVNGFAAPSSNTVRYDSTSNTTIVDFAGQPIPDDAPGRHTFGFAINASKVTLGIEAVNVDNVDEYWTRGPAIPGHVSQQNLSAIFNPALHQVNVTVSNHSDPDTFNLFSVGYLVTNAPFALTSLNRAALGPGSFTPSGIADGTTLTPGGSVTYTISGVNTGQYVTLFADGKFSGSSAGNPYTDLSGRWLEFQTVPEPGSCALLLLGAAALVIRARKRSIAA